MAGMLAAMLILPAVQALPGMCGSADDKCGQNAQGFDACCQNTPSTHVCCDQYHHCACQPGHTNCACYHNSAAAEKHRTLDNVNGSVAAPAGVAGCRKGSCPFSYTNPGNVSGGRCGEVDASSRMPDDIWAYPEKVSEYVNLTIMLYKFGVVGAGSLVNAPCPRKGWYQKGYQIAAWDTPETMKVVCKIHCHCDWPACQDAPDDPRAGNFCSLCGPKFEAPINIAFWYPLNASEVVAPKK